MNMDKIDVDEVMEAIEESMCGLENPGFCCACGERADGVEPDACNYECESCGASEVFGAEELMVMMVA